MCRMCCAVSRVGVLCGQGCMTGVRLERKSTQEVCAAAIQQKGR